MLLKVPLLALLCMCLLVAGARSKDDTWQLMNHLAKCVVQHAEDYIDANPDDPIIIYVEACPEPSTDKSVAMLMENSIVPEVKPDEDSEVDAIVVFTRSELMCLASMPFEDTSEIISLPKKPQC